MGRISEKNPRYRSKEQMAADVAFILTAPLAYGTKAAVVSQVCWVWTEFDGKYDGCPYWSQLALEICGCKQDRGRQWRKRLAHEHAVPKRVILHMLMESQELDEQSVFELLDQLLIGVVLLREEHGILNVEHSKEMPSEFFEASSPSYLDPWLRYRHARAFAAAEGMPKVLQVIRVTDGTRII